MRIIRDNFDMGKQWIVAFVPGGHNEYPTWCSAGKPLVTEITQDCKDKLAALLVCSPAVNGLGVFT